jgi:sirohydrochlorin cobaltochelatase
MPEETLLIGHGSKDPEGNLELEAFARLAGARHCMLDYVEPSIPTAFAELAAQGVARVTAIPYFLFAGGHVKHDIPRIVSEERRKYPKMEVRLARHLGVEEGILRATADRLGPIRRQAVLLVGRGSLEPEPIADMAAVARNFAEMYQLPLVEHCFIALAPPDLPTGIGTCRAKGAQAIAVVPYFLFTGVLVKRIHRISLEHGAEVRPHLGLHDELVRLVHARRDEAWRA